MNHLHRLLIQSLAATVLLLGGAGALFAGPGQDAEKGKSETAKPEAAPTVKVNKQALLEPDSPEMNKKAPAVFNVTFDTSKGPFTVEVKRDLSPHGVDRFYNLVVNGFYNDCYFFRVVPKFMMQWGINGDPAVAKAWYNASIPDDPVKASNKRGTITFAKRGTPNSRTTQLFVNFADNSFLDNQGFSPFGVVVEGMEVVDEIYSGYGDAPPRGKGPQQQLIQSQGNDYLKKGFDKLDYIKTVTIVIE